MPVRSRGSLLAGTAALAGLFLAGIGCQSSHTDHDSFSHSPGQPVNVFVQPADPSVTGAVPGQPIATSTATPRTPAPVTLQPVPTARGPAVIASSWQPVQRVSAEQPILVPGPNQMAIPPGGSTVVPVRSPVGSAMPVGPPGDFLNTGPVIADDKNNNNAAPPGGAITLPAPRALGAPGPEVVVNGATMLSHPPGPPPMPREFQKQTLPPYVVEPPDILLIQASDAVTLKLQVIEGQHLVAPDGTVNLGIYGKVYVTGMTLDQVADAVARRLKQAIRGLELSVDQIKMELQVDVLSYNSKYYYVITDGGGYGQQVYPFLITGNETVLDAIARVNGLPAVATKKKIWVARATRPGQAPKILPVDWRGVAQCGESATNYQIFPGDRVFVQSDIKIRIDSWLAKFLSPIQRGLGTTLLGASTVNSIKNGSVSGAGLGGAGLVR